MRRSSGSHGWLRRLLGRGGGAPRIRVGAGRGLRFDPGPSNPDYATGDNELPVQDALARELRRGDVFYDIGANVGFFTAIAARLVGPGGRVVAFEPVPENAVRARENAARNGFANVVVLEMAAYSTTRRGDLALARYSGGSMIAEVGTPPDPAGRAISVELVAVDDLVAAGATPPPAVVKIDVEGGEAEVLAGMRATLARWRPIVLFEVDDRDEAGVERRFERCRAVLEPLGYRLERLPDSYPGGAWRVRHALARPPRERGAAP